VVGDDDQAIYRFRGASLSNILEFKKYYPHAATRVVAQNYRSSQDILDCAYRLIQFNNPGRLEALEGLDKRLLAARNGTQDQAGQAVFYSAYDHLSSELASVSEKILASVQSAKRAWKDHAILVRSNAQAESVLNELNYRGIPSRFSGARGLYKREEVRHCLRFLYALAKPTDDRVLFDFLVDKTWRVPVSDLKELLARSRHMNKSLYSVLTRTDLSRNGEETELDPEAFERVEKALTSLAFYDELAGRKGIAAALYQYLNETGIISGLLAQGGDQAERQIANLARFFDRLKTFDQVEKPGNHLSIIEYIESLVSEGEDPPAAEADLDADAVAVSTVHMAKGLEWPVVFVVGLEDLHFPTRRQGGDLELPNSVLPESGDERSIHVAEERRLFYVAMTRAREELQLSFSRDHGGKTLWKRSPFLQEALNLGKDETPSIKLSHGEKLARHAAPPEHSLLSPLVLHKPDETLRLSYYPIDDYLTCPLKYKIAHGLRLKPPANFSITYGNVMHKAVQEYNRAQMEGRKLGMAELGKVYEQGWSSEGFYSREHEEERYTNGLKRLEAFLESAKSEGRPPLHIELPFEFHLSSHEILVGRMDRVDQDAEGKITICDYKTSNVHDSKKAKDEVKKSLQLAIYALAWRAMQGALPESLELYFLESGLREKLRPDADYVKSKEAEIKKAFEGIREGNFKASPDFNSCRFCAYNRICPESAAI
jgi:DNA helicase-2/ATP-dependent DNA helicase PcrA